MPTTAKARFLEDKPAASWMRDVVDNPKFQVATDAAMLQLTQKLGQPTQAGMPPVDPIAQYSRLVGAQQYLAELLTIADQAKPLVRKPANDNLDHQA